MKLWQLMLVKVIVVAFLGGAFLGVGMLLLKAQAPSAPGAPQAASGTITILINGVPVATGGVLNLRSGAGVIASASPDAAINGTDIKFDVDTAVVLTSQADQAGIPRSFVATSNYPYAAPQSPPDGLHYIANTSPVLTNYTAGQALVMIPDVPSKPGAVLNIGNGTGIGPVAIQGTCAKICIVLAFGSPVNAWVVVQ